MGVGVGIGFEVGVGVGVGVGIGFEVGVGVGGTIRFGIATGAVGFAFGAAKFDGTIGLGKTGVGSVELMASPMYIAVLFLSMFWMFSLIIFPSAS